MLQYLIELHRDGLIPFHTAFHNFNVQSPDVKSHMSKRRSSANKADAIDLLAALLRRRKRWDDFHLYPPRSCPPDDTQFRLYEFCGGYLAHCMAGNDADSIIFQDLEVANGPDAQQVHRIPIKCADFTFDLAQDLLVVVEARARYVVFHIYSKRLFAIKSNSQSISDYFPLTYLAPRPDMPIRAPQSPTSTTYFLHVKAIPKTPTVQM